MTSFAKQILAIVGLLCVMHGVTAGEHINSWGDLSKTGSYFIRSESKVGIPFIHREATVTFPDDFRTETLNYLQDYTIRAIKHVENSDDECVPTSEITKGGIDQKFAEVKITSGSGCGLKSVITFTADRPK